MLFKAVRYSVSWLIAITANTAFTAPEHMYLFTGAVNNYTGNGGGASNLRYPITEAAEFSAGCRAYIPGCSHSYRAEDRSCQRWNFAGANSWSPVNFTPFVFFSGHGNSTGFFLGNGVDYKFVTPTILSLGFHPDYPHLGTRWFMGHACQLFNQSTQAARASHWNPAFRGLHVALSFVSNSYDHSQSHGLFDDFWYRWGVAGNSIWMAFRESEAEWGYRRIGSSGLRPGCLSASNRDYCSDSYSIETNVAASNNSGQFHFMNFGTPTY